jgi:hypothetical protein
MVFRNQCGIKGVEMRNIAIAAIAFVSAAITGCAQPSTDQRELARVRWLSGIEKIIQSGDLANYQNVATQLNLTLEAKGPIQAKDVDGKITGENIDVDTVPPADLYVKGRIRFHYGIYIPNDKSYRRAILIAHNIESSECVTASDIYKTFGYVRGTTYPHSTYYSIDYHFNGGNPIDLYLTFNNINDKCAEEISIFQNRWR